MYNCIYVYVGLWEHECRYCKNAIQEIFVSTALQAEGGAAENPFNVFFFLSERQQQQQKKKKKSKLISMTHDTGTDINASTGCGCDCGTRHTNINFF